MTARTAATWLKATSTSIEIAAPTVVAVWAFLATAAFVPLIPSGSTYGRDAAIALGAALLIWRSRVALSPGHLMLACLLAWIALGFLWTTSSWDTAGELVRWSIFAAVFCVAFDLDDLDPLWTGVGAGMAVSAIFAIGQHFGVRPTWFSSADPVLSVYAGHWSIYDGPGSVGLFLSKNMAADAATLAVVGCCTKSRWVFLPAAVSSLWLVGGRTGIVAIIAAGIAWAWITFPGRRAAIAAAVLAIGLCALPIALTGGFGIYNDRLEIWAVVVRNLTMLGYGAGTFASAAPGLEFAHNEFLHYWFELGIGSVFLWGTFAYALASGPVIERCVLVALLTSCLVWFPLHAPLPAFVGLAVAGHLCGRRHRAHALERARGMARSLGLFDGQPAFGGAMQEADVAVLRTHGFGGPDVRATNQGRWPVSSRPEHPMVAGAVRGSLPGSRAKE